MGLFGGSKASTTSNVSNQTQNTQGSVGDLSTGNIITAGDYNYNPTGLVGEELFSVLEFVSDMKTGSENLASNALSTIANQASEKSNYIGTLIERLTVPIVILGAVAIIFVLGKKN